MTVGSNPRAALSPTSLKPQPWLWRSVHVHDSIPIPIHSCARPAAVAVCESLRFGSIPLPSPIPEPLPDVILAAIAGAWRQPRVCVPVGFAPPLSARWAISSLPALWMPPACESRCDRCSQCFGRAHGLGFRCLWLCLAVACWVSWGFHVFLAMPSSGFSAGLLCAQLQASFLSGMATVLMVL